MLEDLIISKVRVKVLKLFFLNPDKIYHVREIVRQISEEINAVRRELKHLEKAGLLTKEPRGNRLYYSLRKDYPLYYDLLELIGKTCGIGGLILANRRKLGKIKFAMVTGGYVRKLKREKGKVDLLVVGEIVVPELTFIIKQAEKEGRGELNYTVMSDEEFNFRKSRNDPFLASILAGSRVMIIGDEEELVGNF